MPNDEPVVRYTIKNEFLNNKEGKEPPLAEYEDFSDVLDYDEVDGELTPLTNGVEEGILVARKGPNRKIVPSGFFPQWPTFYSDVNLKDENVPNLNLYQQKKSMAQGMLDLALLSANANQLRYILDSNERNHYFYVSLSLISMSLVLQVLVAIALVFKSRYNMENVQDYEASDKINNFIMIGILLITISNVVSSAFAPAGPTNI